MLIIYFDALVIKGANILRVLLCGTEGVKVIFRLVKEDSSYQSLASHNLFLVTLLLYIRSSDGYYKSSDYQMLSLLEDNITHTNTIMIIAAIIVTVTLWVNI